MKRVIERTILPTQPIPKLTRVAAYARVSSGEDAMLIRCPPRSVTTTA